MTKAIYNPLRQILYISLIPGQDIARTFVDETGIEWDVSNTGERVGFRMRRVELIQHSSGGLRIEDNDDD